MYMIVSKTSFAETKGRGERLVRLPKAYCRDGVDQHTSECPKLRAFTSVPCNLPPSTAEGRSQKAAAPIHITRLSVVLLQTVSTHILEQDISIPLRL